MFKNIFNRQAGISFAWNLAEILLLRISGVFIYLWFAFLIGAEDFAFTLFVSLIANIIQGLSKFGPDEYYVIETHADERNFDGVASLFFFVSIVGCCSVGLISNVLAYFLSLPLEKVLPISLFFGAAVFFAVRNISFDTRLRKKLDFETLFKVGIFSSLFSFSILVLCYWSNVSVIYLPGIWALNSALAKFLCYRFWLNPGFIISLTLAAAYLKQAWKFTVPIAKSRVLLTFGKNLDSMLVGLFAGAEIFSTYQVVRKLVVYPVTIAFNLLMRWLFPFFAAQKHIEDCRPFLWKSVIFLTIPLLILAVFACTAVLTFSEQVTSVTAGKGYSNVTLICMAMFLTYPLFPLATLLPTVQKLCRNISIIPVQVVIFMSIMFASFALLSTFSQDNYIPLGFPLTYLAYSAYGFGYVALTNASLWKRSLPNIDNK